MTVSKNTTLVLGQVLFIVLKKEMNVYPVQISEIVSKKTLSGEDVSYFVRTGNKDSNIALTSIEGEIFNSAEEARKTLTKRARLHIDKIVDNAIRKSNEWYDNHVNPAESQFESSHNDPFRSSRSDDAMSEFKAELLSETNPNGRETDIDGLDEGNIIVLPDGQKAKVRSVQVAEALKR
jgi:hypothetical protein